MSVPTPPNIGALTLHSSPTPIPAPNPRQDPYTYTPHQVILLLTPHVPPRFRPSLTSALLANDVDGPTLLTIVTYDRLKTDLNIQSMGHRGRILRLIDELRARSEGYMSYIASLPPKPYKRRGKVRVQATYAPQAFDEHPSSPPYSPPLPPTPQEHPLLLPPALTVEAVPQPVQTQMPITSPLSLLTSTEDEPLVVSNTALLLHGHGAVRVLRDPNTGEAVVSPYIVRGQALTAGGAAQVETQDQEDDDVVEEGQADEMEDHGHEEQVYMMEDAEDSSPGLVAVPEGNDMQLVPASSSISEPAPKRTRIQHTLISAIEPPEESTATRRIQPNLSSTTDTPAEGPTRRMPTPISTIETTEEPTAIRRIQPTLISAIGAPAEGSTRRIQPTHISTIEAPSEALETPQPQRSASSSIPEVGPPTGESAVQRPAKRKRSTPRKLQYLPSKGRSVDALVYGRVDVGGKIDGDKADEPESWYLARPPVQIGYHCYIERQIRYLLRTPERVETTHNGHLRIAIKPYRSSLVKKHHHQAITVYTAQPDGTIEITKETTETLPLPWDGEPVASQSTSDVQMVRFAAPRENVGGGDWDYLLKWKGIDDDLLLPVLGDSGSEGEYSLDTWAELTAENGGVSLGKPIGKSNQVPLTSDEIMEVLDEGEQALIANWRKRGLPRKEAQAWRIYRAAKKKRERKKTAHDAKVRVEELNERIANMKKEIVGVGWTQKKLVKKQAKVMELSVVEREENKWLAALMERKTKPQRPEKPVKLVKLVKPARDTTAAQDGDIEMVEEEEDADDEDGESLGSTSEDGGDFEDDEGLDGFIVSDNERDTINGVEIEVDGEEEVAEALAQKAAEEEKLLDSDVSGSDSPPKSSRRARRIITDSDDEEGQVIVDNADQEMSGIRANNDNDDDDDIIEVGSKVDKGKGRAVPDSDSSDSDAPVPIKAEPALPQINRRTTINGNEKPIVIDLTVDDDDEPRPQNPWKAKQMKENQARTNPISGKKNEESIVAKKSNALLEKMVRRTELPVRMSMLYRLQDYVPEDSYDGIMSVAQQLYRDRIKDVPGLSKYAQSRPNKSDQELSYVGRHNATVFRAIATIYVAWALGTTHPKRRLKKPEVDIITDNARFRKCMAILKHVLLRYTKNGEAASPVSASSSSKPSPEETRKRESGATQAINLDDEDKNGGASSNGRNKKKLKPFQEDAQSAQQRAALNKAEKLRLDRLRAAQKRNRGHVGDPRKVQVNLGHYVKHNPIFLDEAFANCLKPHQVEGVLFMWQQLIQAGQNRGALLAHTMGLGKTLQVIVLLHTIAAAVASGNKKTYEQIPEHLRQSKTLILSPPGLVENWWEEFHRWLPSSGSSFEKGIGDIGHILRADAIIALPARIENIQKWHRDGGVLLIGYQAFRHLLYNKNKMIPEELHQRIKRILLEEPRIIVADEAHLMKNQQAKISEATRGFKSMSRIAMTGSPLSNNLMEYWSMIEWIDPSFLGPRKEFDQKYVQPINAGLYADSSHEDRRKCLKMLMVLKKDIGPKIHRMDVTAIQNELPAKTEFMIKVPLTDLQQRMYKKFVLDPLTTGQVSGMTWSKGNFGRKFFDAVHLMALICGHPYIFVETLELRERDNQAARPQKTPISPKAQTHDLFDINDSDEDDVSDLLSVAHKPYRWARELLSSVREPKSIEHSYKMVLVKTIIQNAIKAGDKVLVFTHSKLTLSFIEGALKEWCISFLKLDGQTPMNSRQKMTKDFNRGSIDVGLISTEAGGLGLNLPGANRVIVFDYKWSPMWEEQAIGRAYRIGQKKHVYVYRFHASGTYEEIIRNAVLFKSQLQTRVVDQQDPVRSAVRSAKAYFNLPQNMPKEDLSEFKGKDPLVLDSIIEKDDFVRAIENTETFMDISDTLTEEEIKEADQLLQQEIILRSNKNLLDVRARQSDMEFRITEPGSAIGPQVSPHALPQAPPLVPPIVNETDVQLRREDEEQLSRWEKQQFQPEETSPSKIIVLRTQRTAAIKLKAPPPLGANELVASLPPTTAGRTRTLSIPNFPVAPLDGSREGKQPSTPGADARWSGRDTAPHASPAGPPSPTRENQTTKRSTASLPMQMPQEINPVVGDATTVAS